MVYSFRFPSQEFRVWVSFMEIYNEQVRDLLAPSSLGPGRQLPGPLAVREHPVLGVYVPGLTEAPCPEAAQAQELVDLGMVARATGSTPRASIRTSWLSLGWRRRYATR